MEEDGTMSIMVSTKLAKDPNLNGIRMAIDGSLCVKILENGNEVGEAYLCAPGFDEMNLSKVGFKAKSKYSVIGVGNLTELSKDKTYTFDIRPVNIWVIEM